MNWQGHAWQEDARIHSHHLKVWLDSQNLKTHYHKKIGLKQEGPFEIDIVLGPVTYQLKLPEMWKIHNDFHTVLLRLYTETEAHGNNYPQPLPDLLEGEEVYTVERILKHQCRTWLSVLHPMGRLSGH